MNAMVGNSRQSIALFGKDNLQVENFEWISNTGELTLTTDGISGTLNISGLKSSNSSGRISFSTATANITNFTHANCFNAPVNMNFTRKSTLTMIRIENNNNSEVVVFSDADTTMSSSTISNNTASVSPLSVIMNYSAAGSMSISTSAFRSNFQKNEGGALYFAGRQLDLSNTIMMNNMAQTNGGALRVVAAALSLTACDFVSNTALSNNGYGGSIHFTHTSSLAADVRIVDCNFNESLASNGGAVSLISSNDAISSVKTMIRASSFLGNRALTSGGSVFVAQRENSTFSMIDCRVSLSGAMDGGALMLSSSLIYLVRCNFNTNSAQGNGGAISMLDSLSRLTTFTKILSTTISIEQCLFTRNEASNFGGAVYIHSSGAATFNESSFQECAAARGGGGAVFTNGTRLVMIGGLLHNNTAPLGGALFTHQVGGSISQAQYNLSNVVFTQNSGVLGGGIYCHSSAFLFMGILNMSNCSFAGNAASEGGGLLADFNGSVRMDGTLFKDNRAEHYGGGASFQNQDALQKRFFMNNTFFINNSASYGGGLHLSIPPGSGGNVFTLQSMSFEGNRATSMGGGISGLVNGTMTIRNSTFEWNQAQEGGATYFEANFDYGDLQIILHSSNFSSNGASYGGGGVSAMADKITVELCQFISNSAGESGGALNLLVRLLRFLKNYVLRNKVKDKGVGGGLAFEIWESGIIYDEHCLIQESVFESNSAIDGEGGGAYLKVIYLNVSGTVFKQNAAGIGGAMRKSTFFLVGHSSIVSSIQYINILTMCSVFDNSANDGGGFYFENKGYVDEGIRLHHSIFINNKAIMGGAILSELVFVANNITMQDNVAESIGGGMLLSMNAKKWTLNTKISNSIFDNNRASSGGGLYLFWNASSLVSPAILVRDTNFTRNTAGEGGGAVDIKANHFCQFLNSQFQSNIATEGGAIRYGAIQQRIKCDDSCVRDVGLSNTYLALNLIKFHRNAAVKRGGAISYYDCLEDLAIKIDPPSAALSPRDIFKVNTSSCEFMNNTAEYGAGIHISSSLLDRGVSFLSSISKFNRAFKSGGLLFTNTTSADGLPSHFVYLQNSSVFGNTAKDGAVVGGFHIRSLTMFSCSFVKCNANETGAVFSIKVHRNFTSTVINSQFSDNRAKTGVIGNISRVNEETQTFSRMIVSDSSFVMNVARSQSSHIIHSGDPLEISIINTVDYLNSPSLSQLAKNDSTILYI
jgi:predicted outer membrane repeat protein